MKKLRWQNIREIIFDFSVPENFTQPMDLLAKDLGSHLPCGIGLSVIHIRRGIPFCIRWPEPTTQKIKEFNSCLNRIAPSVFNWNTQFMDPVDWKQYSRTQYDAEFNIPLNIGYSMGIGIQDSLTNRQLVYCLHNARRGRNFKEKETALISQVQPFLQNIYNRRAVFLYFSRQALLPRELEEGCTTLSPRERELFNYLTTRLTMEEIAAQLGISRRTVETHALHIYQKLCICSRKELQRFLLHNETESGGS
jgi:DNA-binding CsgD family transcriptional regulator